MTIYETSKPTSVLWVGSCRVFIILLLLLGLAGPRLLYAEHRVFVGSCMGEPESYIDFWDDVSFNDSICRTVLNADTVVNLFSDGYPHRGGNGFIPRGILDPKYQTSFIDDTFLLSKLDSLTAGWSRTLDSTDVVYFLVVGHGGWESIPGRPGYHSDILDYWDNELSDNLMAAYFNRISAYKLFVFADPCETWGNGRHPDSCGFATWLGYNAPESISHKTVILSAAGAQPAWSGEPCDDRAYAGDSWPGTPGLENEVYNGYVSMHDEMWFHFSTGLNGGAEPSEYYSHNGAPGFFFDSIDVNHDSLISVAETFTWDRHCNSQLGWEDNQMLDLGNIAERFILWPRIEVLESLPHTAVHQPEQRTPAPGIIGSSVMSRISFVGFLAAHQSDGIVVFDQSGRRVRPEQIRRGVYFWRSNSNPSRVHKVLIVD